MIEKKRIQIRRDLEQNWIETNPILLYGEIGFDLTNNKIKIGDGERPWNELSWVNETTIDLSNYYTKEEIDEIVSNIEGGGGSDTNANIVDIMSLTYDEQLELIDFVIDNNRFPDLNTLYTYHGYVLNNLPIYSDFWNEENGERYIIFSLYAHPKSYDIRFITYAWNEGKIYNDINEKGETDSLVTKEEVDTLIANSGGSDTNANIVDIMALSYEEQLELINYVIDNNSFPDRNTLYTYRGYILNNLQHYSDWWDEELNQKYIIFSLYAHPKSYDIRFITSDDGFGKIYSDINEKGETETLVTKEEVDTEIQTAIDNIEEPSNATITIIQGENNQSFNLNQQENQTIMLEDKDYNWFGNEARFEDLPDEQKVNGIYYISDKINYKEDITGQPYIVYKTSQLLNDKPFATTSDLPKQWFGTQEQFDALENYETNTTYYIEINGGGGESGDNVDYNTLENRPTTNIFNWNYDQINNLYDVVQMYGSLTEELSFNGLYLNDLEVFSGVGDLNGNDEVNRLEFWNRKYGTPYAIRIFIDFVNNIWWWDRNELDETERLLSEYQIQELYYTKEQTYSKQEIDNIVGLINNELETIING